MLIKTVTTLRLLVKRAIRGKTAQDSNLVEFLKLRADDDKAITEMLKQKYFTYLSPNVQNEIIATMGEAIIQKIAYDIRSSTFFALFSDETTDITTTDYAPEHVYCS